MVNKVALGILAVIVLTAITVGGLVGLQMSDDGSPGEATPAANGTSTPTPTPGTSGGDGGSTDGTADGDGTSTPASTPTPTPTVSPTRYDGSLIEDEARAAINERREEREMDRLTGDDPVDRMALNHSRAMARQGYVTHDAGGFTTAERYEAFGLADRCRIPDNSNTGIRDGEALETIDKKQFDRNYTFASDDRTVTLENETQVARASVDTWFDREESRRKLLLEEASVAGVGVVVTSDGDVYLTVDLC